MGRLRVGKSSPAPQAPPPLLTYHVRAHPTDHPTPSPTSTESDHSDSILLQRPGWEEGDPAHLPAAPLPVFHPSGTRARLIHLSICTLCCRNCSRELRRAMQRLAELVSHLGHSSHPFLSSHVTSKNLSPLLNVPSSFLQPWLWWSQGPPCSEGFTASRGTFPTSTPKGMGFKR